MANTQLSVNPFAVARVLGWITFLLGLASVGGLSLEFCFGYDYAKGFIPLFDIDKEQNIPTFFSVLLLLFSSMLLALIAMLNQKQGDHDAPKWGLLSSGFLYMAYDEAFRVHERWIGPIRALLGDTDLGAFYFAWVLPGIVVVLILGLFLIGFIFRLPETTRRSFLLAATLYLGGAIGVEMIGGWHAELHGTGNPVYRIITNVEEIMEMTGLIVFIWALLRYSQEHHNDVRVRFSPQ